MRKGLIYIFLTTLAVGVTPSAFAAPSQADIDRGKELAYSRKDASR